MAKLTYKHNYKNTGDLMRSKEMADLMGSIAQPIQVRAGSNYEWDTYIAGTRAISSVYTTDRKAIQDNLENNTLLKAL